MTLFGLVFGRYPIERWKLTKIVWRMTGSGPIAFESIGPSGERIKPEWVKEHFGSNWQRPGDEWGTAFRFSTPGCWTVRVTRGGDDAAAGVLVVS